MVIKCHFFRFPATILKSEVGFSENLDFSNQVSFVCLGVRLIDTVKITVRTPAANIGSVPITLDR